MRAALLVPFVLPTVVMGAAFLALAGPSGLLGVDLTGTVWIILWAHVVFNIAVVARTVGRPLGAPRSPAGRGGPSPRGEPLAGVPHRHPPAAPPRLGSRRLDRLPVLLHVVRRGADPRWVRIRHHRGRDLAAGGRVPRPPGGGGTGRRPTRRRDRGAARLQPVPAAPCPPAAAASGQRDAAQAGHTQGESRRWRHGRPDPCPGRRTTRGVGGSLAPFGDRRAMPDSGSNCPGFPPTRSLRWATRSPSPRSPPSSPCWSGFCRLPWSPTAGGRRHAGSTPC